MYDAFGRLTRVEVLVAGLGEDRIAQYRFNGLGFRIMTQTDADFDGVFEDGERTYLMYDERWRVVASFVDASATPKEAFIYHAAGLAGRGGSSYIDSVILRDRDNAGDSALEERRVYVQNWRADVVAVTLDDGRPWEYVRYSSYGEATVYPVADVNRDGVVNSADATDWNTLMGGGTSNAAVDLDLDRDGNFPDPADSDLFDQSYAANAGLSGKGRVSSASVGNRKGYAGYEWDETISVYHVRHRVYLPEVGRWSRRDPLGYVDGMSLYQYVAGMAVRAVDPSGMFRVCPAGTVPSPSRLCVPNDGPYQRCTATCDALRDRENTLIANRLAACLAQADRVYNRCMTLAGCTVPPRGIWCRTVADNSCSAFVAPLRQYCSAIAGVQETAVDTLYRRCTWRCIDTYARIFLGLNCPSGWNAVGSPVWVCVPRAPAPPTQLPLPPMWASTDLVVDLVAH